MSLPSDVPPDLSQKSLIHLHKAAQTILPVNQSLSSHLGSHLLSTAHEADINLPQSYIETRFCRRCGTLYVPGVTCLTRCSQSRRQKRKAKGFMWVVCECKVCNGQFRTEVENSTPTAVPIKRDSEIEAKSVTRKEEDTPGDNTRKRRKRETLKGLIGAIEKSKAEKIPELGLQDLMKFP
jgi:RNase P subunit RPR2